MKKQELIHLHGLLSQVQTHYQEQTGQDVDMEGYEDVGVMPTSIHRSKTDHKEAVFALSHCLTADMETEETTTVPSTAD